MSGDGDRAFGSDGMLYATDRDNNIIVRIDADHGAVQRPDDAVRAGVGGELDPKDRHRHRRRLAGGGTEEVPLLLLGGGQRRHPPRRDPTGIVSTVAGGPGKTEILEGPVLPGSINQPGAIHFAATGELLVAVPREDALVQIRLP
ncbi:MAG TPA: hypothetical protein VGL86_31335 [Polyangia bacterium]